MTSAMVPFHSKIFEFQRSDNNYVPIDLENLTKKDDEPVKIVFFKEMQDYPDLSWQERQLGKNYRFILVQTTDEEAELVANQMEQIFGESLQNPLIEHFHDQIEPQYADAKEFYRYCRECGRFARYFNQRQDKDPVDKIDKLAFIFFPTTGVATALSLKKTGILLDDLTESGYEIILYKPQGRRSVFQEAIRSVNELFGQIDHLLFWGHGDEDGDAISFVDRSLVFTDSTLNPDYLRDHLKPDAIITMHSCNIGKPNGLAQRLSEKMPNYPIYAAKIPVLAAGGAFYSNKSVYFFNNYLADRIIQMGDFLPKLSQNITACFKFGADQYEELTLILKEIPDKIDSLVELINKEELLEAIFLVEEIEEDFTRVYEQRTSDIEYCTLQELKKALSENAKARIDLLNTRIDLLNQWKQADGKDSTTRKKIDELEEEKSHLEAYLSKNQETMDQDGLSYNLERSIEKVCQSLDPVVELEQAIQYMHAVQVYQNLIIEDDKRKEVEVEELKQILVDRVQQGLNEMKQVLPMYRNDPKKFFVEIYMITVLIKSFENFLN